MRRSGRLVLLALGTWQAAVAHAATRAGAINALDSALSAGLAQTTKMSVDNGTCLSKQHSAWKHYLHDADDMVLGIQTDCYFPGKEPERVENPVRFNMRNVTVHMDDGSLVITCSDLTPCLTVETSNSHPMAGQTLFVWSFKPLKADYGPAVVANFVAAQDEHNKLAADNKSIDEQIAAERMKTGVATLSAPARK